MSGPSDGICCIVLSWFGATLTRACTKALIGQPIDLLYLIDNSADAGECRTLRVIAERLRDAGMRVEVRCNDANLGFARAINAVIASDRRAGGHAYYLLLNNDALVPTGGVAGLRRSLRSEPPAAMASPRIRTDGRCDCWLYYYLLPGHIAHRPSRRAMPYLTGACLLLDAAWISDGGPFDEGFFFYGEDILLNWQLRRRGAMIRCAEDIVVEHIGSASSGGGSRFYETEIVRGHLLLANRLARSTRQRYQLLLGRLVYLAARAALRAIRLRDPMPIRALGGVWLDGLRGTAGPSACGKGNVPRRPGA